MMWKEVKTWATSHGYNVQRTKIEEAKQSYKYYWEHKSNPSQHGQATSVFNLAKDIYNSITGGIHIAYQQEYIQNKTYNNIHSDEPY